MNSSSKSKSHFQNNFQSPIYNLLKNNDHEIKKTDQSNFELTSKENVDSIGVIASSAVCSKTKIKNQKRKGNCIASCRKDASNMPYTSQQHTT